MSCDRILITNWLHLYSWFSRHHLRSKFMLLFWRIMEQVVRWWKVHSLWIPFESGYYLILEHHIPWFLSLSCLDCICYLIPSIVSSDTFRWFSFLKLVCMEYVISLDDIQFKVDLIVLLISEFDVYFGHGLVVILSCEDKLICQNDLFASPWQSWVGCDLTGESISGGLSNPYRGKVAVRSELFSEQDTSCLWVLGYLSGYF